jgi:hypothetical protein
VASVVEEVALATVSKPLKPALGGDRVQHRVKSVEVVYDA